MQEANVNAADMEADPLYNQAVEIMVTSQRCSISLVQRHLGIGYNRAALFIENMERGGIVSAMQPDGNRKVLVAAQDLSALRAKVIEVKLAPSRFKGLPCQSDQKSVVPQPFAGATSPSEKH